MYEDGLAEPRSLVEWTVDAGPVVLLASEDVAYRGVRFDGERLGWIEYREPASSTEFGRRTLAVADLASVRAGRDEALRYELGPGGPQFNWVLSNGWAIAAETEVGGELIAIRLATREVFALDAPDDASFSPLLAVTASGRIGTGYRPDGTFGRIQTIWMLEADALSLKEALP